MLTEEKYFVNKLKKLDTTIPLIKTNKNAKYYRTYLLTIREELSDVMAKSKGNANN